MSEPLTTPEVDLRDFPYMPVDVVRLRDSDTAIMTSGEAFRAAVLLWCAAWHQIPAASVPDDDRSLAHLAGFGRDVASWAAVREEALRGFVKCSDGRLYHKTIAEKALEAWEARKGHRERLEKARQAKAAKASEPRTVEPSDEGSITAPITETVTEPVSAPSTGLKGREGKGRDINISSSLRSDTARKPSAAASALLDEFNRFYAAYPKHTNRKAAIHKFGAAVKAGVSPQRIIDGAARFAEAHRKAGTLERFIPAPDVWLNKAKYDDEDLPQPDQPRARAGPAFRDNRNGPGYLAAEIFGLDGNGRHEANSSETVPALPFAGDSEPRTDGRDDGGVSRNPAELLIANGFRRM